MRELELYGVGSGRRLSFDFGDQVRGVDVLLGGAEVVLDEVFQLEADNGADPAVLRTRLRIARFDVERLTPLGLVRIGEHAHVGDLEAVEAQALPHAVVEVAVVEVERELLVGGEADLIFGLQVEATVAGVVARTHVAPEAAGDPLDDFGATRLGGLGEVGVAERIIASQGCGRGGEREEGGEYFHGRRREAF